MAETPEYLKSKAGKNALGVHRGPLPAHDLNDDEADAAFAHLEEAKAISLERTETTVTQKAGKHWRRFWCCYLIGNVVFLAIFLPIFFCICIPAIAQRVVDDSDLTLVSAKIMEPRPDSIKMTIKSAIKLPIAFPVRINPLVLDLVVRDMPGNNTYAKVYIPASTIKGNTTLGEEDHPTPLNLPVWNKYVHQVMFMEKVPLSVHGKTVQHLGELHSEVTMDKDIQLQGLGSFAGFSIDDSTLVLPPRPDGTNLIANATLPNPSPFTLEVGDKVVFEVKSGDLVIGNATIDDLVVRPGDQSYPLHGILDIKYMLKNLGPILKEQRNAISEGNLELKTVGKSVMYEGKTVEYYQEPLKSLVLNAKVPIGSLLINTLHGMLNKDGENILSDDDRDSSSSSDTSGLLDSVTGGGSSDDDSSSGGGLLGALTDSKSHSSRDLSDLMDKNESPEELLNDLLSKMDKGGDPDEFFTDALTRLSNFL